MKIPRRWDPGGKGSLSRTQPEGRGHGEGERTGSLGASPQREVLGAVWGRRWNRGVGRNRRPSGAGRGSRITEAPEARTGRGGAGAAPRGGDRVGAVALGDGHRGRGGVWGVSGRGRGRWAGGDNELWALGSGRVRGCRGCREARRSALGGIQSHRVRTTTPVQTVDNIDERRGIGKNCEAEKIRKIKLQSESAHLADDRVMVTFRDTCRRV